ncbi:MAG TPA: trypsin-like peptidase domain-containing protein [Acidimicrobiales bacterium]|nr:trypsin-like peptidase domain-containing protein [Acidimicrobiales bacterium]
MAAHRMGSGVAAKLAGMVVLIGAVVGCTSGGHLSSPTTTGAAPSTTSTSAAAATGSTPGSAAALQDAFVAVVAKVRPQVVQISAGSGLGSGVIYDTAGDVVTNAHVVGSATTFTVQLVDGQQLSAGLVGVYAPDDLAVIKLAGAKNLSPAAFADSDAVQVGDIVFAVGNPLGLSSSVTEGIVSYNGRPVSEGNGVVLPSTIQTSAPINPGNSGGAVVDLDGRVIGIPTLAAADQQLGGAAPGIGFAIPSNAVKLIAGQLIASGHVTHSDRAALDISAVDGVDSAGRPVGAVVTRVAPGGSADAAGIKAGELITAIAGKKTASLADLQTVLAQLAPGQKVTVDVVAEDGAERSVTATLSQLQG